MGWAGLTSGHRGNSHCIITQQQQATQREPAHQLFYSDPWNIYIVLICLSYASTCYAEGQGLGLG